MNEAVKGALIGGLIGLFGVIITIIVSLYIHSDQKNAAITAQKEAVVESFSTFYNSVKKDMTYDEAIAAIIKEKTEVDREIESLTKENISLTNEKSSLESKVDELSEKYEILVLATDEKNIELAIENAKQYANIGEYPKVIEILGSLKNLDFEADKLLKESISNFEIFIIDRANELRRAKQYNESIEYIKDALKIIPNSTILNEKKNEMENGLPKKITEITSTTNRYYGISNSGDFPVDVFGNKYTSGNTIKMYAASARDYGFAVFNTGGNYNYISGILAVSSETPDPNHTTLEGYIEIYLKKGDEYTLLYKSDYLSRITNRLETPEILLNKAEWIEIRFYSKEDYYYDYYFHSMTMILYDFLLYN